MALTPGTQIGPYEVTAQIGVGGMGEVYRATDTNLARQVAIKVLPDSMAADLERLARFDREAKTLAALNHPNIRVEGSSSWRSSTPTKVLQGTAYFLPGVGAGEAGRAFDVSPDGKRLLMIKPGSADTAPAPQNVIVVENWVEELKRLVPAK